MDFYSSFWSVACFIFCCWICTLQANYGEKWFLSRSASWHCSVCLWCSISKWILWPIRNTILNVIKVKLSYIQFYLQMNTKTLSEINFHFNMLVFWIKGAHDVKKKTRDRTIETYKLCSHFIYSYFFSFSRPFNFWYIQQWTWKSGKKYHIDWFYVLFIAFYLDYLQNTLQVIYERIGH